MPFAWYCPQSQSENGESRPIWKLIVRSKKTRAACSGDGSSRSDEEDERRRDAEADEVDGALRGRGAPPG